MERNWCICVLGLLISCLVLRASAQCQLLSSISKTPERTAVIDSLNKIPADVRKIPFTVDVPPHGNEPNTVTYSLQICPEASAAHDFAGLTQKSSKEGSKEVVVGRYNESDAEMSPLKDMITLVYTNGDDYKNACNKTERRAQVIIRCAPPSVTPFKTQFNFLNEAAGDQEDFCHYRFELVLDQTDASRFLLHCSPAAGVTIAPGAVSGLVTAAPDKALVATTASSSETSAISHGLGAGSIILILVLVPVTLFFMVGSLYKRFVVGAQGWEQVPFVDFWRRCGSLQSEGCRYVFGRGRSSHGNAYDDYTAVSTDEERQPALDRDRNGVNDDHLLPM